MIKLLIFPYILPVAVKNTNTVLIFDIVRYVAGAYGKVALTTPVRGPTLPREAPQLMVGPQFSEPYRCRHFQIMRGTVVTMLVYLGVLLVLGEQENARGENGREETKWESPK